MPTGDDLDKTIIQQRSWENSFRAGKDSFKRKNYDMAEQQIKSALVDAGKLGDEDPRLGNIYGTLAEVYHKAGKLEEAEQTYQKTIKIWVDTLGKEYTGLVAIYRNYSELLCKMKRKDEAGEMKRCADAIVALGNNG